MIKKTDEILKQVLEQISPSKEEMQNIEENLHKFKEKIRKKKDSLKINAEIFVGGSFAKKTLIQKDCYDVDIFVRFDKKYKEKNLSEMTKKLIAGMKNIEKVHGSRDYFRIRISPHLFFEVVPVLKVAKPKEAQNITDLSYSHVSYIKKKIKNKKILDEIRIAKAFCHANNCYGAESYINGFSGYALELLVYYYKGFLKFIHAISKMKEQEIIDMEKHYKTKRIVLMDMNSAKLKSPIILVDPTYKQRNALAALSEETFKKFQKVCIEFLKKPSIKAFEIKKPDIERIGKEAGKRGNEFVRIRMNTSKQEGDVAGSKLIKFHRHLKKEIVKYFDIKKSLFQYDGKQKAESFFVVKNKKEILVEGPYVKDKKNCEAFRKKHKKTFVKKKKVYARKKIDFTIKEFLSNWRRKNQKQMKDMSIKKIELIK